MLSELGQELGMVWAAYLGLGSPGLLPRAWRERRTESLGKE